MPPLAVRRQAVCPRQDGSPSERSLPRHLLSLLAHSAAAPLPSLESLEHMEQHSGLRAFVRAVPTSGNTVPTFSPAEASSQMSPPPRGLPMPTLPLE